MPADLKSEIAEWQRRGAELKAKLEARRREMAEELAEVERNLGLLAASGSSLPRSNTPPLVQIPATEPASLLTLPAIIRRVISEAPGEALTSKQIVAAVQRYRVLKAARIHSELFRMKERGQLETKGDRPHTMFLVPKEERAMDS
jgi:hypothetical protein